MKTFVPVRKHTVRLLSMLIMATGLTMVLSSSAIAGLPPANMPHSCDDDTILVQKLVTSKKYSIKLYPNATHEVLFFSASGEDGKVYQLFLFDLEGNLVKQANIRNKQTTVLNNMEKGNYLFEVFSEDERIENGQVIIR